MKTYVFRMRMDPQMRDFLYEQASNEQNTDEPNVSEYVRNLIMEKRDKTSRAVLMELHSLENQIIRLGNNLNQIAYEAHISGVSDESVGEAKKVLEDIIKIQSETKKMITAIKNDPPVME